jgi:hypothetical protein
MVSLLKNYYNADIVEQTTYAFSPSKIYHVPSDTSLKGNSLKVCPHRVDRPSIDVD